ncbi:MAG: SDR family oxidoreductase [Nitrospinae bacterium]|nr:SDR family oxidoreductase [Nitrospinota bacterium]
MAGIQTAQSRKSEKDHEERGYFRRAQYVRPGTQSPAWVRTLQLGQGQVAKILVTGAAGFLGSHLADRLIAGGHRVIGVDNFITGDRRNIAHLAKEPLFEFVEQDINKGIQCAGELDFVINLASLASPVDYSAHPLETLLSGSVGSYHCLELAKEKKAVYLFSSTSEVYGDPAITPQSESYWGNVNPVGPRSCYDESKRFGEALTMTYLRQGWVDTRIIRIFNTFGPRMRKNDGRAVPNFIVQALTGEPITVYGDGSQTRSFCYVDDLINGIVLLLFSNLTMPVNIGNPNEMTILAMAKQIKAALGSKSEIVFNPLPGDDPKQRNPDITLARARLGYEPKWTLGDGLAKTIEFFKEN